MVRKNKWLTRKLRSRASPVVLSREFHEGFTYGLLRKQLERFVESSCVELCKTIAIFPDSGKSGWHVEKLPVFKRCMETRQTVWSFVDKAAEIPQIEQYLALDDLYEKGMKNFRTVCENIRVLLGQNDGKISLDVFNCFATSFVPVFQNVYGLWIQHTKSLLALKQQIEESLAVARAKPSPADSPVDQDDTASDDQAESASLAAVPLTAQPSTADEDEEIPLAAADAVPALSLPPQPQEEEAPDWMADLMGKARECDFVRYNKYFTQHLSAYVRQGKKKVEITFRSPRNQKLIKIFYDMPHGAQLEKRWPAWRYNMIAGLEAAGFAK